MAAAVAQAPFLVQSGAESAKTASHTVLHGHKSFVSTASPCAALSHNTSPKASHARRSKRLVLSKVESQSFAQNKSVFRSVDTSFLPCFFKICSNIFVTFFCSWDLQSPIVLSCYPPSCGKVSLRHELHFSSRALFQLPGFISAPCKVQPRVTTAATTGCLSSP